ncbi:MAG: hypothetical protein KME11_15800 [Timaviella obliquedivisa GSE-PSE-MK23-08B]|jgi:hypothetical protein|nr:hypothetical protein [Timaviella obliquedivisa GSE-PSE-MK23-08B]
MQGIVMSVMNSQLLSGLLGGIIGLGLGLNECNPAIALDAQALLLLTQPLTPSEVNLLEQGVAPANPAWVTANTISQTGLTMPSLWWAKQQFGGKLLTNWIAKPGTDDMPNRVDLLVNQQAWTSYNYLDRYAFLNQMGRVAQDFGYSTRVFNAQGELLGAYICDFDLTEPISSSNPQEITSNVSFTAPDSSALATSACRIFLDPSGVGAVRGAGTTGAL